MYINWVTMHYASDTYNIMNVGYEQYALRWSLKDGRLFMAIITYIASKVNMPINLFVIGNLIVGIFISCLCVIKIKNIVLENKEKNLKDTIIVTAIAFFTIFNFMYIENMYFVESSVMAISLLCFIYSANNLVEKNKIILPTILAIIGITAYQGTIGFLMAFTFLITLIKDKKDTKTIIIDFLKATAITVIAIIFNMLLVKVIGNITGQVQNRVGSVSQIFSNIIYIIHNYLTILKDSCGLFPKYLFLIFIEIIFMISIIYDIKNKTNNTIKIFFITVVTIASGFLVSVGTLSSFYTGRLRFCIGAVIGFLLIYMFVKMKNKNMKIILTTMIIIYGIANIWDCLYITNEHKQVNKYEKQEVEEIQEYIENKEVNKIAILVIKGKSNKTYFEEINSQSVITYNALRCDWAAEGLVNFYIENNLQRINLTKEQLEKYSKIKDDKGYEIVDDILVLETYMY